MAATEVCHRELAATGADLSAYNSTESAADFADLRKVLGFDVWNVYGTSYGSYLAQTLMRDHPEGIRSVVLDSVLPTTYNVAANWQNASDGFGNIFQACAAEPACNAAHPHLEQTFTALVNKLEAAPLTATVKDPATGEDVEVVIDGGALIDWLRNQNYGVPMLQAAPNRIDGLAAGRPDAIEAIALDRASRAPPPAPGAPALGFGLALGVSCRESYPFATPEDLAAAGRKAFPDYPASIQREGIGGWAYFNEDCRDVWKVPAAPEAMHRPVASSHPDPPHLRQLRYVDVACRRQGRGGEAVHTQPSSASLGIGHFVSPASPCAQDGHRLVPRRSGTPPTPLALPGWRRSLRRAGLALRQGARICAIGGVEEELRCRRLPFRRPRRPRSGARRLGLRCLRGPRRQQPRQDDTPAKVIVGAYINDIQELDFKTNNYVIDLYVWFRWNGADTNPSKTMEFMNRFASDDNRRDELYDEPQIMPDGSRYDIIRYQGRFSTKFPLEKYPFDTQYLTVTMEDTLAGADAQIYVPDAEGGVTINPNITLPGFKVGKPEMRVVSKPYPTNFGDLSEPEATDYSRVTLSIPVSRPVVAMAIKTFVPIMLIVVCAALVFFVRPRYVEARIGLGITALLTLVALQITSGASLPDVDYLMMIDKIYLLAYLFIIIALVRIVATSWGTSEEKSELAISRTDRVWVVGLIGLYVAANVAVAWSALAA